MLTVVFINTMIEPLLLQVSLTAVVVVVDAAAGDGANVVAPLSCAAKKNVFDEKGKNVPVFEILLKIPKKSYLSL